MATTNMNGIRVRNALNLVTQLLNSSYIAVSKPTAWVGGDETPPVPTNSVDEFYDLYNQMLAMKRISSGDVFTSIERVTWQSGATYDMYRHDYTSSNIAYSGATNLFDANYIVVNQIGSVYVCLFNSNNEQSTVEPQSLGDEPFYTSDGYQWLRVYNLTTTNIQDNTTDAFIPVATETENDVVVAAEGAIYTVVIGNEGAEYTSSPGGVSNQLPFYFCKINGDGEDAVARVTVSEGGSITNIEVVRNGSGYSYGRLVFEAGKIYENLTDLDANINGLDPLGDGTFSSKVILPPVGGWGENLPMQLGARNVIVFSSFVSNQNDFLPGLTFRQVAILSDLGLGATTLSMTSAIHTDAISGPLGFTVGETISQTVDIGGVDHIAYGLVTNWKDDVVYYIQDPKLHADTDGALYEFSGGGNITGLTSGKMVQVDVLYQETTNDRTFINGYSVPEADKFDGNLVYLSNIRPVLRSETQSEQLTMVIRY